MKQRTLKRFLSMTLAILMVFTLLPMSAFAAFDDEIGDYGPDGMNGGGEGLVIEGTGGDCVCTDGCTEDVSPTLILSIGRTMISWKRPTLTTT